MLDKYEASNLQILARELLRLADISVFNYLEPDTIRILNILIMAKESGLKALFELIESGETSAQDVQSLILAINTLGCNLSNYDEETGQAVISFLLDKVLAEKWPHPRRVALALLGEILAWCFHDKKESIDKQLLGLLLDDDPTIRFSMLQYVRDYQTKDAVPHLIILLDTSEDGFVYQILQALKKINSPEALLALKEWDKKQKGRA
jgi:HEAT repeat protein